MKRIIRILLVALVLAGMGGGYFYYRSSASSGTTTSDAGSYMQAVQVQQGNLSTSISVVGQLEPDQSASLAFEEMSGTANLLTLTVEAGNTVKQGQVLATIDPAAYQQALDQAQSDLLASQETLADLQAPATALEIAQADVKVSSAEQALEQAKADLADLQSPDLTELQNAVQDAKDNLSLLEVQNDLAERDSLAKSERDLQYSVNWYQRRISQLQAMEKRNLEQDEEITMDQQTLAETQADLARVQSERELARQARAAEIAAAQAKLADAQDALADAQPGKDALSQAQAEQAVAEAEVNLQATQAARAELDSGADATALATAQANLDKKQLAVSNAQAALAATQLTAPFAGTVLETNVSQGGQVTANTIVLTLANLDTLQVVAAVDETTIRQVSAGQSAAITFDAFPDQAFTGQVLSVPLQGTLQGDVMVYSVPVSLTGADDLTLLVGMTANVEIATGTAENALLIPTVALQQSNGLYQVLVPNTTDPNGKPEAVPVEIGLSDGTYTQVTQGLNAGDTVYVQVTASSSSNTTSNMGGNNVLMQASRTLSGR